MFLRDSQKAVFLALSVNSFEKKLTEKLKVTFLSISQRRQEIIYALFSRVPDHGETPGKAGTIEKPGKTRKSLRIPGKSGFYLFQETIGKQGTFEEKSQKTGKTDVKSDGFEQEMGPY